MSASLKRMTLWASLVSLLLAPMGGRAAGSQHNPFEGVAVAGTSSDGNVFKGTLDVLGFVNDGGVAKAVASLNGTLTTAGGVARDVAGAVVLVPVANAPSPLLAPGAQPALREGPAGSTAAAASCPVLHLDLGPVDLTLLGLHVHLNEVVLDITAQPGAGNLVGNLLCAVAGLLDGVNVGLLGAALTNALVTLLNNLITAL